MQGESDETTVVHVSVPATCMGFSTLGAVGMALDVRDVFTIRTTPSPGVSVVVSDRSGGQASAVPRDGRNLVVQALHAVQDAIGDVRTGLRVTCENAIPQRCGYGSSASAIVAGAAAAVALSQRVEPSRDLICDIASQMAGDGANVAAAVYGGVVTAWDFDLDSNVPRSVFDTESRRHPDNGFDFDSTRRAAPRPAPPPLSNYSEGWHAVAAPVSSSLTASLITPRRVSRHVPLPDEGTVPLRQARQAARRSSALFRLLSDSDPASDGDLFAATAEDAQLASRNELLPDSWQLMTHLRSQGLAAFITGSGPAIVVLSEQGAEKTDTVVRQAIRSEWLATGRWSLRTVGGDKRGVDIDRSSRAARGQ